MRSVSTSSSGDEGWEPGPSFLRGDRVPWLIGSLFVLITCWALLWSVKTYWNPLFFFGLWASATVLVRTLQGEAPLPLPRQLLLMVLSVPLWWWFEFVNGSAQNWKYQEAFQYTPTEYILFASLTFSTVVPALDAAWHLSLKAGRVDDLQRSRIGVRWGVSEVILGLVTQLLVFLAPTFFYAFVWVAPFLVLDGLVGLVGGPNLVREMSQKRWRLPLAVAVAGMGCGLFWEFWNFWATPKWTYDVPFFHFWQVFEMPLLGYLGYVPFAWCVFQLVQLAGWGWSTLLNRAAPTPARS